MLVARSAMARRSDSFVSKRCAISTNWASLRFSPHVSGNAIRSIAPSPPTQAERQRRASPATCRNAAAIELENNFMTRYFAQIGAIAHPFFVYPNFSKAHFANKLGPATPIEIENRHRLFSPIAQPFYSDKGSEMIPRRHCELTCSNKNSRTIFHCPIPVLVLDGIGRGEKLDSVIAE